MSLSFVLWAMNNFNPRAPRGARLATKVTVTITSPISIHALREERDFQFIGAANWFEISIHALREERDAVESFACSFQTLYFNPRAPRGARLLYKSHKTALNPFQSTRSARSATTSFLEKILQSVISIHALREERD